MEPLYQKLDSAMKKMVNSSENSHRITGVTSFYYIHHTGVKDYLFVNKYFEKQYPNYSEDRIEYEDRENIMERSCEKYAKFLKTINDQSSTIRITMRGHGKELLNSYGGDDYGCIFTLEKK